MIKSMTGFGHASAQAGEGTMVVEVKTLNSKFFDLSLRLPRIFSEKEIDIRNLLTEKLERGKISVSIEHNTMAGNATPVYQEATFMARYAELKKLADRVMAPYDQLFEIALKTSDVQSGEKDSFNQALYDKMILVLNEALDHCNGFRESEGTVIGQKIKEYVLSITDFLVQVEKLDPTRIEKIRSRLKKNATDFFGEEGFDLNRLEQEIMFYVEKLDIHEERVRLRAHLEYFLNVMNSQQSNGKKLGFISQEIGREINTIGSKANDAGILKEVVKMKEELEKIKEQLNNVL